MPFSLFIMLLTLNFGAFFKVEGQIYGILGSVAKRRETAVVSFHQQRLVRYYKKRGSLKNTIILGNDLTARVYLRVVFLSELQISDTFAFVFLLQSYFDVL